MKKGRGKPRGKSHQNLKDEQRILQQPKSLCSVCRFSFKPSEAKLTCQACKKVCHPACYNYDYAAGGQPFLCDMCKQKKRKNYYCVICDQLDSQRQLLKSCRSVGSQVLSPIHVQCAILSPIVQIQSYSKLLFIKKQGQKTITKFDCCGRQCHGLIIHCVSCSSKGHFRCKIVQIGQIDDNYMISRWLDKCQRYEFLLNFIIGKKKSQLKTFFDSIPRLPKQGQLMICSKHSEQYPWCYCDNQKLSKKPQNPDYQCDKCDRSVHQPCSGLPPKYPKSFICAGCKENDIFKKQLKLNELIEQIIKIQKLSKFSDQNIRFLNAFPFKYSVAIEKKIIQNIKQIEVFFAKKFIQKLIKAGSENEKKNIKRLTQLLIYLIHGEKWKQYEAAETAINQIQQSGIIKKLKLSKEFQEKLQQIINLKQKEKKKSKQYQSLKQALIKFINQWRSLNNLQNNNGSNKSKVQDRYLILAYAIKQIQNKFLNVIADSEKDSKLFIEKFNETMGNQIFGNLINKQCSVQLIAIVLRRLSKINFHKAQNKEINEQQYYKILSQKGINIPNKQKNLWSNLILSLKNEVDKLKIIYSGVKKQQSVTSYQNSLKQNINNFKLLKKIQAQALQNQVCTIGNDSTLTAVKMHMIEQKLLKKKILRICSDQDFKLAEQKLKYLPKIQQFMRKKKNLLNQQQKLTIDNFIGKAEFLWNIIRKGQSLQQYNSMENRMNDVQNAENQLSTLYFKLFHILDHWDQRILSSQFLINQFFTKIIQRKVQYKNKQIEQRLKIFYKHLIGKMQFLWQDDQKISTQILRRICKILNYFNLQNEFPIFTELLQSVRKWSNIFPNDQIPSNIAVFLQKTQRATNLIKVLDAKISSGFQIEKVNLNSEINKLCLLRQWCKLTQKMSLLSKSKATINAVQTLKGLLDKCNYPQNLLFKKVNQLQIQGKNLNVQVNKFLQKPKLPQYFKFTQQLKFISNKMSLQEGYSIKNILERCNLDVYVQTQQLQNQIKQFQSLPVQLGQCSQKKSLAELNSLRKKYIDSCFKVSKLDQYEKFLRKIYTLRCINFQPPITRQEYFELLTVGGVASIELQQKTSDLLKAYRILEKAQHQLTNSNFKRRNFNNLLPCHEQRYRQIKQDLKYDPTELSKLQKARLLNNKVRQQYYYFRTKKVQIQKFKQIELDLSTSIFNNKDIINEISANKMEINNLVRRVQQVLPYSQFTNQPNSHDNIFKIERKLCDAYNILKIKHPILQKFEHDYRHYCKSEQIRTQLTLENYRSYVEACNKISQVACRIPEFLNARTNQFIQMFRKAMDAQQYHMHIFQLLIDQGLQLRRLQSPQKDKVFDLVIEVYQKVRQVMSMNPDEISDSENEIKDQQDQQIISSSQQNQDSEDEDEMDIEENSQQGDYQDESDNQDSDEQNQENGKDNNQIILDSD